MASETEKPRYRRLGAIVAPEIWRKRLREERRRLPQVGAMVALGIWTKRHGGEGKG
jgi:hypothetical protein